MEKLIRLEKLLQGYGKLAIAFSGGTDSAFLLHEAKKYCDVYALTARSEFTFKKELDRAWRLAADIGAEHNFVDVSALSDSYVCANTQERCYYCKKLIFSALKQKAQKLGFAVLADGTNADDEIAVRPGKKAAIELGVVSPLSLAGLTKSEIRSFSRDAGLETADVPSNSCKATRVPIGIALDIESLRRIEKAEELIEGLGFSGMRARIEGENVRIEMRKEQIEKAFCCRMDIIEALGAVGFKRISLDLKGYDNE